MTPEEIEGKAIADGARVAAFLADEAVARALASLNRQYFDEFKASKTAEERTNAWAKAHVLSDLGGSLQAAIDNGSFAKQHRDQREKLQRRPR